MRRLILLRHAKSSWADHQLSDWERPLNNRGIGDAPKMAERLKDIVPSLDFILCSDARRTQETLAFFLPILGMSSDQVKLEHRIYEADLRTLISIIEDLPDTFEAVMVIGHNPGLSLLNLYYTGEAMDMPTCCFVEIIFEQDSWTALSGNTGIMRSFEYPKKDL
jgi:phosphohistidine phosphatase